MAREAFQHKLVKVRIHPDARWLLPEIPSKP
ncbi:hypothetical protein ACLK1T_10460 [Escherichia coli]